MSSKSTPTGSLDLTVTFEIGTDVDMAQVLTQNRVAHRRAASCPRRSSARASRSRSSPPRMVLHGEPLLPRRHLRRALPQQLRHHAASRTCWPACKGVGKVTVFGAKDFSMRIWLDPGAAEGPRPDHRRGDGRPARAERAGRRRPDRRPAQPGDLHFQYNVITKGRLTTAEEFGEHHRQDRRTTASWSTCATSPASSWAPRTTTGTPSSTAQPAIAMRHLPAARAPTPSRWPRASPPPMDELAAEFPEDLELRPSSTTPPRYIEASITEVVNTLIIAIILVVFGGLHLPAGLAHHPDPGHHHPGVADRHLRGDAGLGMSINNLTLFGLVLVIGIVVDDAIVVVENTMRLIDEKGWDATQGHQRGHDRGHRPGHRHHPGAAGGVRAHPVMPGLTGRLYKQFAITISVATVFSSINALTLSPALCRPAAASRRPTKRGWFFSSSTTYFDVGTEKLQGRRSSAHAAQDRPGRCCVFAVLLVRHVAGRHQPAQRLPAGRGPGLLLRQRPAARRRLAGPHQGGHGPVNAILQADARAWPSSWSPSAATRCSTAWPSTNAACAIVTLDNWSDRGSRDLHIEKIMAGLQRKLFAHPGGHRLRLPAAAHHGPGRGRRLRHASCRTAAARASLQLRAGGQRPGGRGQRQPQADAHEPELPGQRAAALPGHRPRPRPRPTRCRWSRVFSTLGTYLGSAYVNDFNLFGRTWRVHGPGRRAVPRPPDDIGTLEVRSDLGAHGPAGHGRRRARHGRSRRPSTASTCSPPPPSPARGAPGVSVGRRPSTRWSGWPARSCRRAMGYQWSGVTYQQMAAGNLAPAHLRPGPRLRVPVPGRPSTRAGPSRWRCCCRCRVAILGAVAGHRPARAGQQHLHPGRAWCC